MKAVKHLKSYGVTPVLKSGGKIGVRGLGRLPEHARTEIVTWARNNRESILKDLAQLQKGQKGQKGGITEKEPISPTAKTAKRSFDNTPGGRFSGKGSPVTQKRHRLVTKPMVESWRVGRKWILEHLGELETAGWTRHELLRAGRFRYPCGRWSPAFTGRWTQEGVKIGIDASGAITFTWADTAGRAVRQKAARVLITCRGTK